MTHDNDTCTCGHIRYVHGPDGCLLSDCPCTEFVKADESLEAVCCTAKEGE